MIPPMGAKVLARTSTETGDVQLVEHKKLGCFLQWIGPDGAVIDWSPPLSSDPASLAEAREFFPDHLPWGGLAVDGNP